MGAGEEREREEERRKGREGRERERASHSRGPRGRALVHDEVLEELPGAVAGHVDVQRVPVEEAGGLDDDVLRVTTKAKKNKNEEMRGSLSLGLILRVGGPGAS